MVVILGPTGSGKTALSLELATHFRGEIINCDSVAIYREFRLGTAKPTPEEQVRARHHLFDIIAADSYTTAGQYARSARRILEEIRQRGALPIVVGGTGLYLRALLEGLFPGPERSEELRQRLRIRARQKNALYLHGILKKLDPVAAAKIHANDAPKLIRAIEVCLASRKPISEQWKSERDALEGFRVFRIGLNPDRAQLYRHINTRVQGMFAAGLVEETRRLQNEYGFAARPLTAIGYKQVVQHLNGELDLAATISAVQQAHRNYAKRQTTWFRREPDVRWLSGFGHESAVKERAIDLVERAI